MCLLPMSLPYRRLSACQYTLSVHLSWLLLYKLAYNSTFFPFFFKLETIILFGLIESLQQIHRQAETELVRYNKVINNNEPRCLIPGSSPSCRVAPQLLIEGVSAQVLCHLVCQKVNQLSPAIEWKLNKNVLSTGNNKVVESSVNDSLASTVTFNATRQTSLSYRVAFLNSTNFPSHHANNVPSLPFNLAAWTQIKLNVLCELTEFSRMIFFDPYQPSGSKRSFLE